MSLEIATIQARDAVEIVGNAAQVVGDGLVGDPAAALVEELDAIAATPPAQAGNHGRALTLLALPDQLTQ